MIKVNLLKNKVQGDQTTQATRVAGSPESTEARSAIVKVIVLGIATVGLMLYESQNLSRLRAEDAEINASLQELQTTVDAKKIEAEKLKNIEAQAKELKDKLKLLKFLSKLRLREVNTLDYMQSKIPERLWLNSLKYENDQFELAGSAISTPDISEFVKRLDESAFLKNVIVVKNQEISDSRTGYRDFEFTAQVEDQE